MFRGTTPTLNFIFAYNLEELNIKGMYITFKQDNEVVPEKKLSELEIVENKVTINLTQTETLLMQANKPIYIQARIKINDESYATNIIMTTVKSILKDGEI